jgi:hypothetical protein
MLSPLLLNMSLQIELPLLGGKHGRSRGRTAEGGCLHKILNPQLPECAYFNVIHAPATSFSRAAPVF